MEEAAIEKKFFNQFNKIRLWNEITNQIAGYGVDCGNANFFDYLDLNCGAVPEGEYNQIIDVSAPQQFLNLYTQITENRFAFAVTELLKMNSAYKKPLTDFLVRVGQDMQIQNIENLQQAFEIVESFVLDGMPDLEEENHISNKKITTATSEKIVWEKNVDNHESAWEKAGGDISVYYELQQEFVNGLFCRSDVKYKIENCQIFSLMINQNVVSS